MDKLFPSADLADPVFLGDLRAKMLAYAKLQLPDMDLAEDAVQEALAGALKNAGSFGRRSAYKTWVFSILKNKIADIHRNRMRTQAHESNITELSEEEDVINSLFDERGFWREDERPSSWSRQQEALQNEQFWKVFETCLDGLPGNQSHIFMMREFFEHESKEICTNMGITVNNLHIQLYRSRMRLRECLENRWFTEGDHR